MTYLATFAAGVTNNVLGDTTVSDVFTLNGSNIRTVRILKMGITLKQTTSAVLSVALLKRSTANSGGSFSNPTIVVFDTSNQNPTSVVTAYAKPPTLGNLVGIVNSFFINSSSDTSIASENFISDFTTAPTTPLVLRGVNESISWNLNGIALPTGLAVSAFILWTEEIA